MPKFSLNARERGKNSFLGQRLIDVHWTVGLNRRKPHGARVMGNHCKALVTKQNRSSYIQVSIITVKSQSAWDVQSHGWHVKVLDFVSFCGSYVREFELSHKSPPFLASAIKLLSFITWLLTEWLSTETLISTHLMLFYSMKQSLTYYYFVNWLLYFQVYLLIQKLRIFTLSLGTCKLNTMF